MKKGIYFLLGVIVGCLLTFGGFYVFAKMQTTTEQSGIRLAKQKTKFTVANKFEVFQSFEDGALARSEEKEFVSSFTGPIVFLVADGDEQFYDDQVVTVPNGKSAIQIGTYSYESKGGERTVPIIKFE
ncbi:hypothetical protein [Hoylesella timonensis]|nr:hypothetical protein [Hoylesella timonensis]